MLAKVAVFSISAVFSIFCLSADVYGLTYPGDIDGDCSVTWEDMRLLSLSWLGSDCNDSLDADCDVDFEDYAVFAKDWFQTVPEFDGAVYHVTNLQDYNSAEPRVSGSLRDCIALAAADGVPSRIIFDVNGTIYSHAAMDVNSYNSNLTICGTDAPGNGITIDFGASAYPHTQGYSGISISGSNCRVCNIHVTQTKRNSDGIAIYGNNNVIERCTTTWCRDEGICTNSGYGHVIAFCRIEYCGSQPGDDSGGSDGRGLSVFYGSQAIVVGNCIKDNLRGALCQGDTDGMTESFADFRNNLVTLNHQTFGLNVQSYGTVAPNIYPAYANFINNTIDNNGGYGIRYMNAVMFYRGSPNSNIFINDDENFVYTSGTPTEVFAPITRANTPYPNWLEDAATPADVDSVGMGTGRCQCLFCE
jgi:hypothetical protein